VYVLNPLIFTIYKWIQVCVNVRGNVRQYAVVLAVCGSVPQCAAVMRQFATIDLRVSTYLPYFTDKLICGSIRQCGSVQCVRQ
jgi:hypothetical protein